MRLNWFRRFRLDGVTFRLGTAIGAADPVPLHAPIARVESAPRARAAAAHLGNPGVTSHGLAAPGGGAR